MGRGYTVSLWYEEDTNRVEKGRRLRVASQREGSDARAGPLKTCKIITWNTIFDVAVFILDNTTRSYEYQNQIKYKLKLNCIQKINKDRPLYSDHNLTKSREDESL